MLRAAPLCVLACLACAPDPEEAARIGRFSGATALCTFETDPAPPFSIFLDLGALHDGGFVDTDLEGTDRAFPPARPFTAVPPKIAFESGVQGSWGMVHYGVNGALSNKAQIVSGAISIGTRDVDTGSAYDIAFSGTCQFAARRSIADPHFAEINDDDFSCAALADEEGALSGGSGFDISDTAPPSVTTSCFTGTMRTLRVSIPVAGTYRFSAFPGSRDPGTPTIPFAVFTGCGGQELGCVVGGSTVPNESTLAVPLQQFHDVLLVFGADDESVSYDVSLLDP